MLNLRTIVSSIVSTITTKTIYFLLSGPPRATLHPPLLSSVFLYHESPRLVSISSKPSSTSFVKATSPNKPSITSLSKSRPPSSNNRTVIAAQTKLRLCSFILKDYTSRGNTTINQPTTSQPSKPFSLSSRIVLASRVFGLWRSSVNYHLLCTTGATRSKLGFCTERLSWYWKG